MAKHRQDLHPGNPQGVVSIRVKRDADPTHARNQIEAGGKRVDIPRLHPGTEDVIGEVPTKFKDDQPDGCGGPFGAAAPDQGASTYEDDQPTLDQPPEFTTAEKLQQAWYPSSLDQLSVSPRDFKRSCGSRDRRITLSVADHLDPSNCAQLFMHTKQTR